MSERTFERVVLDRMIVLENKMDVVISSYPQCKAKVVNIYQLLIPKVAQHAIDSVFNSNKGEMPKWI